MNNTVRVLHFSPHNENDGIARYQEQYMKAFHAMPEVESTFFDVTPLQFRSMSEHEQQKVLQQLKEQLRDYDVLHIQHEFGLFGPGNFRDLVMAAKAVHKKVAVSLHYSPAHAIKRAHLGGLGPRSLVHYARQYRHYQRMLRWHIEPLKQADAVFVHFTSTGDALQSFGISTDRIHVIPHPVYDFPKPPTSSRIATALHKQDGDVLYCTVGMMHRYKGVLDAVKALKFLPANYKLAVIGGVHPLSEDVPLYNKLCDLIDTLGLHERVYITGFVVDDNEFNALIRECDVCIYPYDGVYYAHVSSGAINLAFSNHMPVIAYPTSTFQEVAKDSDGAVMLTDTYAYYELARELQRVDKQKQIALSSAYAEKMAWPKMAALLASIYCEL